MTLSSRTGAAAPCFSLKQAGTELQFICTLLERTEPGQLSAHKAALCIRHCTLDGQKQPLLLAAGLPPSAQAIMQYTRAAQHAPLGAATHLGRASAVGPCGCGAVWSWQSRGSTWPCSLNLSCVTQYSILKGGSSRLSLAEHPVTKQRTCNSARVVQQHTLAL